MSYGLSHIAHVAQEPVLQIRFALSGGKSMLKSGGIYKGDKMGSKEIWVYENIISALKAF